MEQLLFLLLFKKDMNKLFNFYWKKEYQMLILQHRCYFVDSFSFSFFFSFFFFLFSLSHFFLFFFECKKNGVTPLLIAAQEGHEQIAQLLLEKGNPEC